MKIAINTVYGGYELPEEFFKMYPDKDRSEYNCYDKTGRTRIDPDVISFIESYGPDGYEGPRSRVEIIDIPDDASDWKVYDHDGLEWVTYVHDGKIYECTIMMDWNGLPMFMTGRYMKPRLIWIEVWNEDCPKHNI